MIPPRPRPTRVAVFIDGQNLYFHCRDLLGWPWVHPWKLGQALVSEDVSNHGPNSHSLAEVRYYTGMHDPGRRKKLHGEMDRRLRAYQETGGPDVCDPCEIRRQRKGPREGD